MSQHQEVEQVEKLLEGKVREVCNLKLKTLNFESSKPKLVEKNLRKCFESFIEKSFRNLQKIFENFLKISGKSLKPLKIVEQIYENLFIKIDVKLFEKPLKNLYIFFKISLKKLLKKSSAFSLAQLSSNLF